MAYINVYPTRINWENEPSINTPINAVNLNKIDYAVYEHDRTFANWDTTKANQSDLLLSVKSIDYDDTTGVFIFTWQNGTTKTVDLNVEKIPVSFSMSPQGIITMTNADGTTYTADVSSLIKTYTFVDSSVIDFTVVTDPNGNKTVMADIVDGSITGTKLQPNYLADCQTAKTDAETAQGLSEDSAEDSEAWAVGERGGVPVPSTDPTYENNAKYWAQQANPTALANMSDVDLNSPTDGQVLTYNSTTHKWKNQAASGGAEIDDTTTSTTKVWSSNKTNSEISVKADNLALTAVNNAQTNKHTVTSFEVTTANWTTDTTSQSGSASGSVLPTTAQQEAYDLVQYVTVDTAIPCLYLYASDIPTDGFYINAEGVD